MTYERLIEQYPFLNDLLRDLEKDKTFAYLKYDPEGFYDDPLEIVMEKLWDKANTHLDEILPKEISLEERFRHHEHLENQLINHNLYWDLQWADRWMYEKYFYPFILE